MHWKVRREFLSRVEIFSDLGRRDLGALAKSCSVSSFGEGEFLCRQGERGVAAFLIVSGRVAVESELQDGGTVTVTELAQGAMVGELSIIDGAERVASLRAIEPVETLVLTQWSFQGLMRSRPTIAASMLPIVVARFRETAAELRRRECDSPQARHSIIE
ncbi:MAG: cyclic nucleotide-binding domain-containing protein [Polyangia bacterium]